MRITFYAGIYGKQNHDFDKKWQFQQWPLALIVGPQLPETAAQLKNPFFWNSRSGPGTPTVLICLTWTRSWRSQRSSWSAVASEFQWPSCWICACWASTCALSPCSPHTTMLRTWRFDTPILLDTCRQKVHNWTCIHFPNCQEARGWRWVRFIVTPNTLQVISGLGFYRSWSNDPTISGIKALKEDTVLRIRLQSHQVHLTVLQ